MADKLRGGTTIAGYLAWHSGNMGTLSGLDSDLLDGQHGAYYLDWTNTTNKPDPTLTLSGDVSGSATFTDLGSVTLTTTVADNSHLHTWSNISDQPDPTITLGGDLTGNVTLTNLASGTLTATVVDNSHNHTWSNISDQPDPTITLGGDASGAVTLTNLASGTLTVTVINDSHTHDSRYFTESESDVRYAYKAGTSTQAFVGSVFTGDALKFRAGVPASDDAAIEWLGASNAGFLRFSTADDTGTEYMQFGDYDTTNQGGTFTEWLKLYRGVANFTGNLNATGNVVVDGDLTVNGTTTTINTSEWLVEDDNITLGNVTTPTDLTADGGGITLLGSTNKTITWIDASDSWVSSEKLQAPQFVGTVGTGTAPLTVASTTKVTNLNVDRLDDQEGTYYLDYTNFSNTPTIPVVNNATITITAGTGLNTGGNFTTNQGTNETITLNVDDIYLKNNADDITSGNLTIGSTTKAANSILNVLSGDSYEAVINLHGSAQGTGRLFVGQALAYGGGIYYNGDSNPAYANNTLSDSITLYRVSASVPEWTARNLHNSNNWEYRGTITAPTFIGALTGNSTSADKWSSSRTITLTGDISGTISLDGSANVNSSSIVVANDSHTHTWANITSRATDFAGYGIVDSIESLSDVNTAMTPQADQVLTWDNAAGHWTALESSAGAAVGIENTYIFTATQGQTTFSGIDDNSSNLLYNVGNIYVIIDGFHLSTADYTATDGTSVVILQALNVGQEVSIINWSDFSITTAVDKTIGTTKGDLIGYISDSTPVRIPVGVNGTVLSADSAEASGVKWVVADAAKLLFSGATKAEAIVDGVDITGNLLVTGTLTETSARKYKENITPLTNSLDKVQKLQGVNYNKIDSDIIEMGLIADDVYEVIPEVVKVEDGEIEGINYARLTALLIESVKELKQEIEILKGQINE